MEVQLTIRPLTPLSRLIRPFKGACSRQVELNADLW
jgi:hypothetical protein